MALGVQLRSQRRLRTVLQTASHVASGELFRLSGSCQWRRGQLWHHAAWWPRGFYPGSSKIQDGFLSHACQAASVENLVFWVTVTVFTAAASIVTVSNGTDHQYWWHVLVFSRLCSCMHGFNGFNDTCILMQYCKSSDTQQSLSSKLIRTGRPWFYVPSTLHTKAKWLPFTTWCIVLVLFGGLANLFELHIRQHHFVSEFDASMQGKDYFILEEFCTKRLGVTHSMLIVSNSMSVKWCGLVPRAVFVQCLWFDNFVSISHVCDVWMPPAQDWWIYATVETMHWRRWATGRFCQCQVQLQLWQALTLLFHELQLVQRILLRRKRMIFFGHQGFQELEEWLQVLSHLRCSMLALFG